MGRVVRAASVLVGLGGLSFLIVAGTMAFESFKYAAVDCGSVISPKDPTNRVARTAAIPPRLLVARKHCVDMRSSRAARFVVFEVASPGDNIGDGARVDRARVAIRMIMRQVRAHDDERFVAAPDAFERRGDVVAARFADGHRDQ